MVNRCSDGRQFCLSKSFSYRDKIMLPHKMTDWICRTALQNAQVSDTTADDSSNAAKFITNSQSKREFLIGDVPHQWFRRIANLSLHYARVHQ